MHFLGVRGLCVSSFVITPPHVQPHAISGGFTSIIMAKGSPHILLLDCCYTYSPVCKMNECHTCCSSLSGYSVHFKVCGTVIFWRAPVARYFHLHPSSFFCRGHLPLSSWPLRPALGTQEGLFSGDPTP